MTLTIVHDEDIRAAVPFDETSIAVIEAAFAKLSGNAVVMPPVMQINVEESHGQTCVKSAFVPGDESFAVKLASTYHDNAALGLPNASGLMVVCSARSGRAECILLDNGYLTALRTAAAGAVVARHLSRPDSRVAGLIGAGKQTRLHLEALCKVRPIEKALVWCPTASESERFAADMSEALLIDVEAVAEPSWAMSVMRSRSRHLRWPA